MTDKEIIDEAYEAIIKRLWSTLFDSYSVAATLNEQNDALQRFQKGVRTARTVRDEAKQSLP